MIIIYQWELFDSEQFVLFPLSLLLNFLYANACLKILYYYQSSRIFVVDISTRRKAISSYIA